MERHIVLPASAVSVAAGCAALLALFVVTAGHLNMNAGVFGGVVALLAAAAALGAVAWVGGLMLAARLRRWDWLVGVLVLGPVGALLLCLSRRGHSAALA